MQEIEWFAAVAARYPDLEMIDLVNEPLHAPPAYAAALGGAWRHGWDWLITSFELGRQYFPSAELILNDYNILILPQFTNDYLNLINLLKDRGLIDGIGEQAHFLETADAVPRGAEPRRPGGDEAYRIYISSSTSTTRTTRATRTA